MRDALARLYDPVALQTHPLTRFVRPLGTRPARAGEALEREIRAAIEAMRPAGAAAPDQAAWRRYRGLVLRYVEARDARAVQDELAISQSTYYREHHHAVEAVISFLRARWQLEGPERRGDARSEATSTSPLPAFLTRFVGRAEDLAEVERLLTSARLVTLTGTGGSGKTRLALEVAARMSDRLPDGVWVVELAALADPALVPSAAAAALGVREEPGHPILEALLLALQGCRALIILDNCEHLLDACARLVEAIVRRCADVRILATSREALGIAGEVTRRVPPLATPPLDPPLSVERLRGYEAVQLFTDRAAAVRPDFSVTEQNAAAVAQVCRRLDGIPLALELAAARLGGLTVEQLAARLDQRFRLLAGGNRTALPHHQTLRATIDWSYALLTERERVLFDRLAVFAGGWTLEAAEAVCAGHGIERDDVLDLLLRLVDKSLVVADDVVGEGGRTEKRYRLLDTLREYGRERLVSCLDVEDIYGRHATYYGALAEEAEPHLLGPNQLAWLDRLEVEHDNLRAALRWLQDTGHLHDAARVGGSLHWFWYLRGHTEEEQAWLARIVGLPGARERSAAWARVLVRAHDPFVRGRGERGAGRALVEEGLAIAREVGDERIVAGALLTLGGIDVQRGDYVAARRCYEESLAIYRRLGDSWGTSTTLSYLGRVLHRLGEDAAARAAFDEALAYGRVCGERRALALALEYTGEFAIATGAYDGAHERLCEGLALYREVGVTIGVAMIQKLLGRLAYARGEYRSADCWYRASLAALREPLRSSEPQWSVEAIEGLAMVAAARGRPERALRLGGAAAAIRSAGDLRPDIAQAAALEAALERGKRELDAEAAARAWVAGQGMTLERAIACAVDGGAEDGEERREP